MTSFTTKVIEWLLIRLNSPDLTGTSKFFLLLAIFASLSLFAFYALIELAEKVLKLLEWVQKRGLLGWLSEKDIIHLRRRSLFLGVLKVDLDTISRKENWNDQSFAELDVEVETEGSYYPTMLRRAVATPNHGLRRVSSLSNAVNSMAQKHLLLLGDPGSGKSVALRHLASKMVEGAIQSRSLETFVPLYVNLRDFDRSRYPDLNAETIKAFILDNIRRDSPQTTEFVASHWTAYCERGLWFFLFDSFDEIPDLLHAADGEERRNRFAAVIKAFLGSTGDCHAIIASREFKGPDILGWDKLRIQQLSFPRKEDLVNRSLLDAEDRKRILLFLAEHPGVLYDNPLFLTLLCRYVSEHRSLPSTDYGLLEDHIVGLLRREHSYILRNYKLTSEEAIRAAIELAAHYAMSETLGLSPSRENLGNSLHKSELNNRIDDILAALVSCKIMRRDLAESAFGEVRYAFSHRRYQETLFVRFVVSNQDRLTPTEFVHDRRWREYLVTLLQGYGGDHLIPYLNALRLELTKSLSTVPARPFSMRGLPAVTYVEWRGSRLIYYLRVLHDGYKGKYGDIPKDIRDLIGSFLKDRYETNDISDQFIAVRFAVLCEEKLAMEWWRNAVSSNSIELQNEAFSKVGAIHEPHSDFATYVRRRFSGQVLLASERAEQLRSEALLGRISAKLKCDYVYRRAQILRAVFGKLIRICSVGPRIGNLHFPRVSKAIKLMFGSGTEVIPATLTWILLMLFAIAWSVPWATTALPWATATLILLSTCVVICFFFMYAARDEPAVIGVGCILKRLRGFGNRATSREAFILIITTLALVALPTAAVFLAFAYAGYSGSVPLLLLLLSLFVMTSWIVFFWWNFKREESLGSKTLQQIIKTRSGDALWVLLNAGSWLQLVQWARELEHRKRLRSHHYRRLFAILGLAERGQLPSELKNLPLLNEARSGDRYYSMALGVLLDRYMAARRSPSSAKNNKPKPV